MQLPLSSKVLRYFVNRYTEQVELADDVDAWGVKEYLDWLLKAVNPLRVAAGRDASGQPELAHSYEQTSRHATTELPPLDVLGSYVPRHEAADKVSGRADFVSSIHLAHMLHAKVLRSPHAHARITRIDTTRAEQAAGVVAVVTYRDAPAALWSPPDAHILDDRVRYIGDEVAVVAAETEEQAADALKLIEVEYEVLPAVLDPEKAIEPGAPQVNPQHVNVLSRSRIARGDADGLHAL